ncbi:tubulin-like doman-containing protein [Pseudarthrobacter sp. H2]|uniref:tubulin-like doman-containing protein n=1 Tax=Pseudarthrobacter sp. H2 TaxID=3418415 RepID=UPI003CF853B9
MRKFLIVGCGGSGGSTLAFMMDQLSSELAAHGVTGIPAGWQFVHIDVPVAPDTRIPGVGNVFQQGGGYIATGPSGGSYTVMDNALTQTLGHAKALGQIGTWAPRDPAQITVPIHSGAGQMRAVGRMITLSRASEVRNGLERAFQRLNMVETNSEMAQLTVPGLGKFNAAEPPIVLVVSSMAGGAGASMALDVCRLLSLVPGVSPSLVGVFMLAADVFDGLPSDARGGVRANALAMLGEIVAAQTKAAQDHDVATLAALGHGNGVTGEKPFARVFPVGRFAGVNRTMFGDGTQDAVYRGLGRGLAALMLSGKAASEFVSFDLGNNSGDKAAVRDYFGWGVEPNELPWGAFGFASLSMGRDRYREYAAQRLARTAVDRLRAGHIQPGNNASSVAQVNALVSSQWSNICTSLGLPVAAEGPLTHPEVMEWFTATAFSRAEVGQLASAITDEHIVPFIPPPAGIQAVQWLPALRQKLLERKAAVTNGTVESAYRWGYTYKNVLLQRFTALIEETVAQFGLPYARAIVERLEGLLREQLIVTLKGMAAFAQPNVTAIPQKVEGDVARMKVIENGQSVVDLLVGELRGQTTDLLYSQAAGSAATVLSAFIADVLGPMRDALSEGLKILDQAAAARPTAVGLANVATDQYAAWPSDENLSVPPRFDVADNEILITESKTFAVQYESDVAQTGGGAAGQRGFQDARELLGRQIIRGLWPVAGGHQAPGGLLEQTASWQPGEFNRDPFSHAPLTPSRAGFRLHTSPKELLKRARGFVGRPGEAFDKFCSLSLRDYVRGVDASQSDIPQRQADVIAKFTEAVNRAIPLISVNPDVVQQLHGTSVAYRFKFSSIPFGELDEVSEALLSSMAANPNIASETAAILQRSLTADTRVQRIDIFGSYRNYSPLVFDSVLSPVAQQWDGTSLPERKGFWSQRRSRPLAASLPMGDSERRAMVGGWFVGQITGQLRLPEEPFDTAVEVWDNTDGRWIQFPNPLLTPPKQFLAKSFDWLPAVLESVLLAVARTHQAPVLSSLRPYRLLRELYDASPEEPAAGLFEVTALPTLTRWLGTGQTLSGVPSRVPNVVADSTVAERYELTKDWLTTIRSLAGDHFMPPGRLNATGGGSFSQIGTRRAASATPLFRDVAEDIYLVLGDLLAHLDTAHQRALHPGKHSALALVPDDPEDPLSLPVMGAF